MRMKNKVAVTPARPVPEANPEAVVESKAFKKPKIVVDPTVWLRPMKRMPARQKTNYPMRREKIISNNPNEEASVITMILFVCLN